MQQIIDGLKLMVAGMGTVFIFLTVMIAWIALAAKITARYEHLLPQEPVQTPAKPSVNTTPETAETEQENNNLIVAITTAVHRYRSERRKKGCP